MLAWAVGVVARCWSVNRLGPNDERFGQASLRVIADRRGRRLHPRRNDVLFDVHNSPKLEATATCSQTPAACNLLHIF